MNDIASHLVKTFAFALGQRVKLKGSGNEAYGVIIARGEFFDNEVEGCYDEYFVKWTDYPDESEWRDMGDLVAVPDEASE